LDIVDQWRDFTQTGDNIPAFYPLELPIKVKDAASSKIPGLQCFLDSAVHHTKKMLAMFPKNLPVREGAFNRR
jgi:hypothetical protein